MKHGGRSIKLCDIADYLTNVLTAEGVEILRMESKSTSSIYLKIDYGVCNTIRISDHYSRKCRYNIGPYISHFKVEHGRYDRYYYQSKRMDELTRRILKDRRTLLRRYGWKTYHRYMAMNKEKNMDNKLVNESKDYVIKKLKSTKRAGITDLLEHMEEMGFFTAPASGGNHLCCEGGLVVHTAGVMQMAEKFGRILYSPEEFKKMKPSIYIVAGLHDLGKAGAFGKVYYAENMIKDGRPTKANPEQKYKRSESKPYEINKDMLHIDHPQLSVKEADLYIELTEEEYFAILFHDGMYGSLAYYLKGHERPLQTLLHFADYWVAQFIEGKELPMPEAEQEEE